MKHDLKILQWTLLLNFCVFGGTVKKTMLHLPDTGESTGYSDTFGEDEDYSFYPPGFTVNGNGTVTDTVTGLMWQAADGGEMAFEKAGIYCDSLNLGGFSDWRLPNAHESFSILNHQMSNPALNVAVFTKSDAEYWWSSTLQVNDATRVWVTNSGGGIGNHPKSETISAGGVKKFHIRAVRDAATSQSYVVHFTENGNGTVTDNLTGLVWQKIPSGAKLTWVQSLVYAETVSIGGIKDWRLPNIKELQSINDETISNPSLDTSYFGVTGAKRFWSSTTLPNQIAKAWYWDTQFGITTYDDKATPHLVLVVRGGGNGGSSRLIKPRSSDRSRIKRTRMGDRGGMEIFINPLTLSMRASLLGRQY